MNITKTTHEGRTIFTLSGMLDGTTAPMLELELIPEFVNSKNVTLDFKEVTYISSAGLRVLLLAGKAAKETDGEMTVINVLPDVKDIFDVTGFSGILNLG
jgi:anti-anti-sigma factor